MPGGNAVFPAAGAVIRGLHLIQRDLRARVARILRLVGQTGGKLIRVQVKTHDCDGDCLRFASWSIGTDSYVGAVDWLAFHSLRHGVTAFLKPEEAGVYPTLRYNDIGGARAQKNMRYARDYPLDRVIKELTT